MSEMNPASNLRVLLVGGFLVLMFLLGPLLVRAVDKGWLPGRLTASAAPRHAAVGHQAVGAGAERDLAAEARRLNEQLDALTAEVQSIQEAVRHARSGSTVD